MSVSLADPPGVIENTVDVLTAPTGTLKVTRFIDEAELPIKVAEKVMGNSPVVLDEIGVSFVAIATNGLDPPPPPPLPIGSATGVDAGVKGIEEGDSAEVPAPLVAEEVKVYGVRFDSPVTMQEVAGTTTVQVLLPGNAVTVYEVGVPPEVGATIVTVA